VRLRYLKHAMNQSKHDRVPCVLLMNDMHISNSNIPEFVLNWNEAISICNELDIKYILIGGDLFQSRASQTLDVLLTIQDSLAEANNKGIQVVLANGNHDKVNQESVRGYCHLFDTMINTLTINDYSFLDFIDEDGAGFYIHMIPYFPENGTFTERLNKIADDINWEEADQYGIKHLLYIHEGINGALAQSSEKELPTELFEDFDAVLVGHYHNRKVIDGTKIEYIGSSRQHNFGEDEAKGYTVVCSDGSYYFIQNEVNTRYKVIECKAAEINDVIAKLKEISKDPLLKIKVKIFCTKEEAPTIDKQKLLDAGANKVEIIVDEQQILETSSSSLYVKFNKTEMLNIYKEFCNEKSVTNNLGEYYLSNINELCGN